MSEDPAVVAVAPRMRQCSAYSRPQDVVLRRKAQAGRHLGPKHPGMALPTSTRTHTSTPRLACPGTGHQGGISSHRLRKKGAENCGPPVQPQHVQLWITNGFQPSSCNGMCGSVRTEASPQAGGRNAPDAGAADAPRFSGGDLVHRARMDTWCKMLACAPAAAAVSLLDMGAPARVALASAAFVHLYPPTTHIHTYIHTW